MKTSIYILLLLLPVVLFSQEEETEYSSHGIYGEIEGAHLNQIGYRYRVTMSNSIALSIKGYLFDYNSETNKYDDRNSRHLNMKLLYELSVYRVKEARCFLSMGLGYGVSTSENTRTENVIINNTYSHSYEYVAHTYKHSLFIVAGVGGEYYISNNLSVFIHQNIEMQTDKTTVESVVNTVNHTSTQINIADAKIGLTIYF